MTLIINNKISDYIYGDFYLEDVLIELINCDEVQRLKYIHQVGGTYLVDSKLNVTRYEHSIGAMLLVRLLGGCIKEQIAGLLHDISHTAFSHVVDFSLDNKGEDYHEAIFENVVNNSQIPNILDKYGYSYGEILDDDEQWTILERKAPRLCADRVDYTLRDMYRYGYIKQEEVKVFVDSMIVVNGEIVVNNINQAKWFLNTYYKEVIDFFMSPENGYAYDRLSKAIRLAINKKVLSMEDLLKTDNEVINILKNSLDEEILDLVDCLNEEVKLRINEEKYDIHIKGKVRLIDPGVYVDDKVYSLSELDESINDTNKVALEKSIKGVYVETL